MLNQRYGKFSDSQQKIDYVDSVRIIGQRGVLCLPESRTPGVSDDLRYDALDAVVVVGDPAFHFTEGVVGRIGDLADPVVISLLLAKQEKSAVDHRGTVHRADRSALSVVVQVGTVRYGMLSKSGTQGIEIVSGGNEKPANVAATQSEIEKNILGESV